MSPPVVVIQTPGATDVFDAGTLILRGSATDNTKVAKVEFRVADAGSWQPLTLEGQSFSQTVTLPSVNLTHLPITVHAVDDFGGESFTTVSPLVDTLAPTAQSDTVYGARGASAVFTVKFGERVTLSLDGGWAAAITPRANGEQSQDGTQVTYQLSTDTFYDFILPAASVRDDFGHLLTADGNLAFQTAVIAARAGPVSFSFTPQDFSASSDEDGAAVIAAQSSDGHYEWGRFETNNDGSYSRANTLTSIGPHFQVVAGAAEPSQAATQRVRGFWQRSADSASGGTNVQIDNGSVATNSYFGLIPSMALSNESTSSSPFAYVQSGPQFARPSGSTVGMHAFPDLITSRSNGKWQAIHLFGGSGTSGSSVEVDWPVTDGAFAIDHANLSYVTNVDGNNISAALLPAGSSVYVFKSYGGDWHEACTACPDCADNAGPETDPPHFVAAAQDGVSFLGARIASDGLSAQLLQKTFSSDCKQPWTQVGKVVFLQPATKAVPLVTGGKVGVLAQFSGGVQLFYP